MKNINPYNNFSNYVLRTPLFSFDFYKNLTSKKKISDEDLKNLCLKPIVKESLFLASPALYKEIKRWTSNDLKDKKKIEKLRFSILKYLSRMSSRCTPFGLFAGCAVGEYNQKTNVYFDNISHSERHTRLDMNYLVALSQDLIKRKYIERQLLFYPNSSLYKVGRQLRYIEYKYSNSARHHQIIAIDNTTYLQKIISRAKGGIKLSDLSLLLISKDVTNEEAYNFIDELVKSQILVSELEPSVSGPEFLDQIINVLEKLNEVKNILSVLYNVKLKLSLLDKKIGNDPEDYIEISKLLEQLGTKFDLKYLFQTDLRLNPKDNFISLETIPKIKKGINLLNKFSLPPKNTLLSQFIDAFYERYETREMPLLKVLDLDIGIGYKQGYGSGDVNPLVDNIVLQGKPNLTNEKEVKWNMLNSILKKKLIDTLVKNDYTLKINDNDFKGLDQKWNDLPDTISFMTEIAQENGVEKIKLKGGGGSSAANLLGRFCHIDSNVFKHTKNIIQIESKTNKDKVLAEIVHLPESRVGNILMRPDLREYEIPYLAKSLKPEEKQLPLNDLFISVKNNRKLVLRSKKLNKEIFPHLTNAHGYSYNTLPIYHFLCDLQTQGLRNGLGFHFGPFAEEYVFLPRVEYDNLILHSATWNLKKEHISKLLECKNDDKGLDSSIKIFRNALKIPQFAMLVDGDNELLINFENLTAVRMLLNIVSKKTNFKLTEFLFSKGSIARNDNSYYTNQVIVSFYNQDKLKNVVNN